MNYSNTFLIFHINICRVFFNVKLKLMSGVRIKIRCDVAAMCIYWILNITGMRHANQNQLKNLIKFWKYDLKLVYFNRIFLQCHMEWTFEQRVILYCEHNRSVNFLNKQLYKMTKKFGKKSCKLKKFAHSYVFNSISTRPKV